jgi:hypothetical protein
MIVEPSPAAVVGQDAQAPALPSPIAPAGKPVAAAAEEEEEEPEAPVVSSAVGVTG